MKLGTPSRAALALALASFLLFPEAARALCIRYSTPVMTLSVAPEAPAESSVATVTCTATLPAGAQVASLTVTVNGGAFPSGLQSETITGITGSLQWTTPVAGTYAVTCAPVVVGCTTQPALAVVNVAVGTLAPPPVIDAVQGPPSPALVGKAYEFSVAASDPGDRPLTYQWTASGGAILGSGASASWTAPDAPGTYLVTVTATNDLGGAAAKDYPVTVASALYQGAADASIPRPRRIARGPDGQLFATDGDGALWLVSPAGLGQGVVTLPSKAYAVAASTTDLFVGVEGGQIHVLDPRAATTKSVLTVGISSPPAGMAFEPTRGYLWLAMRSGGVWAMRLDGTVVFTIPLQGVSDVAADPLNGLVWAMQETSDGSTGLLSAYTLDGAPVRSIVTPGAGAGQVYRAGGIAADAKGRIYVSDALAGKVLVVSATGAPIDVLGFSGPGRLTRPAGLTFLANADLLVSDTDTSKLQRFGSGAPVATCMIAGQPDSDCDGLPDSWEIANGLNPAWAGDAALDLDGDGLTNFAEYRAGTSPRNWDTDGDMLADGEEIRLGKNPLDPNDNPPTLAVSIPAPAGPGLMVVQSTVSWCGSSYAIAWTQTGGPTVQLREASTPTPSFVARQAATYDFSGVVTCGSRSSTPATASVTVPNVAPRPEAGGVYVVRTGQPFTLDASHSVDANGGVLTFQWDQTLGAALTGTVLGPVLTLTAPRTAALLAFQATVADPAPLGATTEVPVYAIARSSLAPTAVVTTPVTGAVGAAVALDAARSYASATPVPAWTWTQVAGPAATLTGSTTSSPSFVPAEAGHYAFDASVTSGTLRSPPARIDVYVAEAGLVLPTASAKVAGPAAAGEPFDLDGTASTAGQGGTLTYRWVQVSGPASGIAQPSVALARVVPFDPGTYVFELQVSEGAAEAVPARVTFHAEQPGRVRPVAVATGPATTPRALQKVTIDGAGSTGSPLGYRWRQVAGPWAPPTDSRVATTTFYPPVAATYVFELVVDDGAVQSAPVRLTVPVNP